MVNDLVSRPGIELMPPIWSVNALPLSHGRTMGICLIDEFFLVLPIYRFIQIGIQVQINQRQVIVQLSVVGNLPSPSFFHFTSNGVHSRGLLVFMLSDIRSLNLLSAKISHSA